MPDIRTEMAKRPSLDIETLQRKRFKADELPITSSQRAAIEHLLFAFKKKGGFDVVRKQVWAEFNEGVFEISINVLLLGLDRNRRMTDIILHRITRKNSSARYSSWQIPKLTESQHCCPAREAKRQRSSKAPSTAVMSTETSNMLLISSHPNTSSPFSIR